ncbi:uncharacterized protein CXQ87_005330 [Candidozyma duobushaemuli]|uniref:Uncharacterized protein n=2 Tax=Candidozyma TaxID=3303203 RepID=A0ABX8I9W8_9ASCO|nr:uncharacterized protein CXQ87_005330 [[Candida] duobushaemulonis]PVH15051.1 hypothetical protein CXQ87_005330 [[Candida] duobushaemulonis]QWU89882.1 hypothetical protein CA3LBN_004240 [[Candida] haemuloni]
MPAVSTASTITKASKKKSFPKKTSTDRGSLKESDAHIREKKLKDKKRKRSQRKRSTKENPKGDEVVKEKSSNEGASLKPTNSTPAQQVSKPVEPTKEKKTSKQKFLSNEGDSYYISDFFSFQLILEGFVPLNPGQTSYLESYLTQKSEPCPEVKESPEPEVSNPIQVTLPEATTPAISPKSVTNHAQVATLLPLDFPVFKTWSSLSQTEQTYYPGDFHHFRKCLKEEETTFLPKDFYFWQDASSEKPRESFAITDFFEFRLIIDELVPLNQTKKRKTPNTKKVFLVDDGKLFVTDFFSFQTIAESLESLDGDLSDFEFCLRAEQFDLYSEEPVKTQEVYFPDDFCKFFQLWTSSPKYNEVFLPNDFYFWKGATNDEDTPSFLPSDFFHWQNVLSQKSNESFLPQEFCSFQSIIDSVEPVLPEVHLLAPDDGMNCEEVSSILPSESSSSSESLPCKKARRNSKVFVVKHHSKKRKVPYVGIISKEPNPPLPPADVMYDSDSSEQSSLFDWSRFDPSMSDSDVDAYLGELD